MPLGLPDSWFLGGEFRWTQLDRDKVFAYLRREARRCPGPCRTLPEEWEADMDAYIGDSDRCPGCERLEQERENIPEGTKGARVRLVRPWQATVPDDPGPDSEESAGWDRLRDAGFGGPPIPMGPARTMGSTVAPDGRG